MPWNCSFCSFENISEDSIVCDICEQRRIVAQTKPWACVSCTFENSAANRTCEVCDTEKDSMMLFRTPSTTMAEGTYICVLTFIEYSINISYCQTQMKSSCPFVLQQLCPYRLMSQGKLLPLSQVT